MNNDSTNRKPNSASEFGATCAFDAYEPNWRQELLVYHFYVGQGSSTLIRTPSGTTVLIDAGIPGEGAKAILPVLRACDIASLDYGVISHPHIDHFGGWKNILDAKIPIHTFYMATDDNDKAPATVCAWSAFKTNLAASMQSYGGKSYEFPALGKGSRQAARRIGVSESFLRKILGRKERDPSASA